VSTGPQKRAELIEIAALFEAKIVSVQQKSLTIQMVEGQDKIAELLNLLKPFRIMSLSRSGIIAVSRGE